MKNLLRLLLWSSVLTAVTHGQPNTVITLARTFLGGENALNALNGVRFTGTITTVDYDAAGEVADTSEAEPIVIVFRKDYQQRISVDSPNRKETTALDGYDAWQRSTNPADETQWRVSLLNADQIKRLRANTWENLNFFRGIEERGGWVTDEGRVEVEGEAFHKLAFHHDNRIVFYRYFNPTTGRLAYTETDAGAIIREEGQQRAGGIRFPESVITLSPLFNTNGERVGTRAITVTFSNIEVNPTLPADYFRIPAMTAQ